MNRFFVTEKIGHSFILSDIKLRHLKVLRLKPNEHFICVYENRFFECRLAAPNRAEIIREIFANHEPQNNVKLALGVLEPHSWEIAIQKATELGVSEIIPFRSQFTSKNTDYIVRSRARHLAIIEAAAEQSFRNAVPRLSELRTFADLLTLTDPKVLAYEKSSTPLEKMSLKNVIVIVGPEGGFSEDEIAQAAQANCAITSLGPRILRAETAALYLLSKIVL